MMVSPEWYAEENLKGKTVEELKLLIRSLKREIQQLKKEAGNPNSDGWMICPDPKVQLEMHRLYLKEAEKAPKEAEGYLETDG